MSNIKEIKSYLNVGLILRKPQAAAEAAQGLVCVCKQCIIYFQLNILFKLWIRKHLLIGFNFGWFLLIQKKMLHNKFYNEYNKFDKFL